MQNKARRLQVVSHRKVKSGRAPAQTAASVSARYSTLARYLGDVRFASAVQLYLLETAAARGKRSIRTFPEFLTEKFKAWPEIGELAQLEQSFEHAWQIQTGSASGAPFPAAKNARRGKLHLHSSARLLVATQNTTSIWSSLVCGEVPPRPFKLDNPQHVVVWRQGQTPRFRILGADEAFDLEAFERHPSNVSDYLPGWLETGLAVSLEK